VASRGRKTSCPVALAAVSTPMTRPRLVTNQRPATVAASTLAIAPVPRPTTPPHSTTSCHGAVMTTVSAEPAAHRQSATSTTRRTPYRSIAAAAKGPVRPNSTRLTLTASEMVARDQPKSSSSGTISTPGVERNPLASSSVTKVTPATTQA